MWSGIFLVTNLTFRRETGVELAQNMVGECSTTQMCLQQATAPQIKFVDCLWIVYSSMEGISKSFLCWQLSATVKVQNLRNVFWRCDLLQCSQSRTTPVLCLRYGKVLILHPAALHVDFKLAIGPIALAPEYLSHSLWKISLVKGNTQTSSPKQQTPTDAFELWIKSSFTKQHSQPGTNIGNIPSQGNAHVCPTGCPKWSRVILQLTTICNSPIPTSGGHQPFKAPGSFNFTNFLHDSFCFVTPFVSSM